MTIVKRGVMHLWRPPIETRDHAFYRTRDARRSGDTWIHAEELGRPIAPRNYRTELGRIWPGSARTLQQLQDAIERRDWLAVRDALRQLDDQEEQIRRQHNFEAPAGEHGTDDDLTPEERAERERFEELPVGHDRVARREHRTHDQFFHFRPDNSLRQKREAEYRQLASMNRGNRQAARDGLWSGKTGTHDVLPVIPRSTAGEICAYINNKARADNHQPPLMR